MHTSCELLHGASQNTNLGASNVSRKASHLLATPSVRNTRSERSLANVHARRADLSVAAQAVTETPEDLSIKTLDRPATSLAQPRGLSRTTSKIGVITVEDISKSVHAIILAGGSSDNPLARYRAMPAVELGSSTQLIDIPISNCIRSGVNKLYVLTQFNSHMLNTHIGNAYPPAVFGGPGKQGFVDVLACHQTPTEASWYRGSADAVRRNLPVILEDYRGTMLPDDMLILSGQALYRMDYGALLRTHREYNADITIATHPVGWKQASLRGITRVDNDGFLREFEEKPSKDRLRSLEGVSKNATEEDPFEASMGIYMFKREVLERLLLQNEDHFGDKAGPDTHFGYDVIPHALRDGLRIVAHYHPGYWRDVNSLRDFYEVNLELALPGAPISFYEVEEGIISSGHVLPPALIHDCQVEDSLVGEGSVLRGSKILGCVLGNNSYVGQGCTLEKTLVLGNDYYTNDKTRAASLEKGESALGIGANTVIKGAILDDNVSIGENVRITNEQGIVESDRTEEGIVIQDGIVTVLRNAAIPAGTII
ncbi:Glucose-1-phosphate adenylyltransferase [Coccomyxa sp. Obi]|nr:Glucose-1-phosphate adenylyltransferase [Coccomyxa sp. Obi]